MASKLSKFDRAAWQRQWRAKNPERARQLGRESAARHRDKRIAHLRQRYRDNRAAVLADRREYTQRLKHAAFMAYGGYGCACCGESEPKFLSLDHINNDGNEHRKTVPAHALYRWLRDNNYPPIMQVLCMNCNFGKRMNGGVCPHVGDGPTLPPPPAYVPTYDAPGLPLLDCVTTMTERPGEAPTHG
jgi:hypothetical protein